MKKNPKAIVEIVDSVEQTLEQAHRGLAVARDERFAVEGAALALASLRIALDTLEEAASSRIVEKDVPEDVDEPEPPQDEPEDAESKPERVRVQTSDPIGYAVKVIRYAKTQGLSVRDMGEVCGMAGETIRRYGMPSAPGKNYGQKTERTARRIVEALVAFTGYNRKPAA